jgi:TolA-binding protein
MQAPRINVVLVLAAALLTQPAVPSWAGEADDQFAVAAGHYAAQRWSLAAEEFQKFLADHPDHARRIKAAFFLGEALVQSGDFEHAREHFSAAREADPNGRYARQALFRAGECGFLSGKDGKGQTELSAFCEQYADDPLCAYAHFYLGELAQQSSDLNGAKRQYQTVLERFADGPTADDSRLGLAQVHLNLKEYDDACDVLAGLIEAGRLTVEANYWLGQTHKAQQRFEDAAKAFQAGIAANPKHGGVATLRYLAGDALLRAKKHSVAIEVLCGGGGEAAASLPAKHRYLVALAHQGLGQHTEALSTLEALPADAGDPLTCPVLAAKATSLAALGRESEAIQALNHCLEVTSNEDKASKSSILARLALAYARNKQFEDAKAALLQLSAAAGENSELTTKTAWEVAQAAMAARQTTVAGELQHALSQQQTTPAIAAEAQRNLAHLAVENGELEKAAALYEQFLKDHADGAPAVEAALACADVRERLKQFDAALAMYQLVIQRHADSAHLPMALLRAGTLYDRLSQEVAAIEQFERVVRDYPDSPLVPAALYGWGWSLYDLKKPEEANAKFGQLRRDYPDSPYWADATYRLAEFAMQAKDLDRAQDLLDELIDAAQSKAVAGAVASDELEPSPPKSDSTHEPAGRNNEPQPDDGASRVPAETLRHALYLRAQVAISGWRWKDAEADLERLIREHADWPLAFAAEFLRADVAYRSADYEAAAQRFDVLASKIKGRKERWVPLVPLRRAQVFAQQKRWTDARAVASAISKDYPDFDQQYEVDYLLGRCHAAEADLKAARECFQKVVRSPNGSKTETAAMAQWMIGETYFLQEQYSAAVREYLRVEVLYAYPRWQAAALLQAGKCYEQMGGWNDAAETYGRLLKLYPQTDFAGEARERLQSVESRTAARTNR